MSSIVRVALDIGSVALKMVTFDDQQNILSRKAFSIKGSLYETLRDALHDLNDHYSDNDCRISAMTGSVSKFWTSNLNVGYVNSVTAILAGTRSLVDSPGAILSIGGERTHFIRLAQDQITGEPILRDHKSGSLCSSGAGLFIEREANRFGLSLDKFVSLALESKHPIHLAGRCAVFAKTDAVHQHQSGAKLDDIANAICRMVARNISDELITKNELELPLVFLGGVGSNKAVVRSLSEILGIEPESIVVPTDHRFAEAIGAHQHVSKGDNAVGCSVIFALEQLERLKLVKPQQVAFHQPLPRRKSEKLAASNISTNQKNICEYSLGIDIGSTTTNAVILSGTGEIIEAVTIPTKGQSIAAVQTALSSLSKGSNGHVPKAVGITGSGRKLVGKVIGADLTIDEITAHAEGCLWFYPKADTIIDIGGQDSKFIKIYDGYLDTFEMNKVCSAGTGSFLEEAATDLGLDVRNGFAETAMKSTTPVDLGDRCAVFVLSELKEKIKQGYPITDLAAGLCYSIVANYLSRVVGSRTIGNVILFQGGVAGNAAVVATIERVLGKRVEVHRHNDIAGAVGAALLAGSRGNGSSTFCGFNRLPDIASQSKSFSCRSCNNGCNVRYVDSDEGDRFYFGSTCGRWELPTYKTAQDNIVNPIAKREQIQREYCGEPTSNITETTIGIPSALSFHELLPFWTTLFNELGIEFCLSRPTDRKILEKGNKVSSSSSCLPLKTAYGHSYDLVEQGVTKLFLPSIASLSYHCEESRLNHICPGAQAWPYTVAAELDSSITVLSPTIRFGLPELCRHDVIAFGKSIGYKTAEVATAFKAAESKQSGYYHALRKFGMDLLDEPDPDYTHAIILSRPYEFSDSLILSRLQPIFDSLKIRPIPYDMIDDQAMSRADLNGMYWYYGKRFLQVIESLKDNNSVVFISLSTHSCGADAFIIHFLRDALTGRPFLELELDQHGDFTGVHTRLEAFVNSLNGRNRTERPTAAHTTSRPYELSGRTVMVPQMSDHAFVCAKALEAVGQRSGVLPLPDHQSIGIGRTMVTGGECLPCTMLAGDMMRSLQKRDKSPDTTAFMMISGDGPCRLGQYPYVHRNILDRHGYENVPVVDMSQDTSFYDRCDIFSSKFKKIFWRGSVAIDLLYARCREIRPIATEKESLDRAYQEELAKLLEAQTSGRKLVRQLRESVTRLREFQNMDKQPEITIGVIGENYVRCNRVANRNIVEKLEERGVMVCLPSLTEWIHYTNWTARLHCRYEKTPLKWMKLMLIELHQQLSSGRLHWAARGGSQYYQEPSVKELFRKAKPYVPRWFEGETIISVARTVDYHDKGVDGIIQVVPFGCMVGTIYETVSDRLSRDLGNMPITTIRYDGQSSEAENDRLDSFLIRAKNWKRSKGVPQ